MKKRLIVTIKEICFGGYGHAIDHDGKNIFVYGDVLPQEKVEVEVLKENQKGIFCRSVKTIIPSEKRANPRCAYFGICTGCFLQNLSYKDQLLQKQAWFEQIFSNKKDSEILGTEIIGLPDTQHHYRHKTLLNFFYDEQGNVDLGYFYGGSWQRGIGITGCDLYDKRLSDIIKVVKSWAVRNNLTPYHSLRGIYEKGMLRNITIRKSHAYDQWMIALVTTQDFSHNELLNNLIDELKSVIPLTSFYHRKAYTQDGIRKGKKSEDFHIWGKAYITERIKNCDFNIKYGEFFQNNIFIIEKMIDFIIENINHSKEKVLYDLFCGVGTFSLTLADCFKRVKGIEIVESAIDSAKENAALNNLSHVEFECFDVKNLWKSGLKEDDIDVIIVDPPRAGLSEKTLNGLLKSDVNQIVYVSCNPQTLQRDLNFLENAYSITNIQGFDLFPQTYHFECIAFLEKKL